VYHRCESTGGADAGGAGALISTSSRSFSVL